MNDRPDILAVAAVTPSSGPGWEVVPQREVVPHNGKPGRVNAAESNAGCRDAVVVLSGDWVASDDGPAGQASLAGALSAVADRGISFESSRLGRWDSTLLVFVNGLRQAAVQRGMPFDPDGLPPAVARLLALASEAAPVAPRKHVRQSLVDRTGQGVLDAGTEVVAVVTLVGETVLGAGAAMRGGVRMRATDLLSCVYEAGASALPIVTIVNVLVGGIVAFVGAVQLRRFGADVFIADLVGVAVVREMAALMTAIVMSGRTGGAYAAHIATMQGNEEIDALRAIGIPTNDYLILPRIAALTGMMPMLYLYGCLIGIFGGFLVTVVMLNMSPTAFVTETRISLAGGQFIFGLIKSIAFGALIAIVGCRSGLRAGRSAADVGLAATKAVVMGIVGVIALDAVFAVVANALDI